MEALCLVALKLRGSAAWTLDAVAARADEETVVVVAAVDLERRPLDAALA